MPCFNILPVLKKLANEIIAFFSCIVLMLDLFWKYKLVRMPRCIVLISRNANLGRHFFLDRCESRAWLACSRFASVLSACGGRLGYGFDLNCSGGLLTWCLSWKSAYQGCLVFAPAWLSMWLLHGLWQLAKKANRCERFGEDRSLWSLRGLMRLDG